MQKMLACCDGVYKIHWQVPLSSKIVNSVSSSLGNRVLELYKSLFHSGEFSFLHPRRCQVRADLDFFLILKKKKKSKISRKKLPDDRFQFTVRRPSESQSWSEKNVLIKGAGWEAPCQESYKGDLIVCWSFSSLCFSQASSVIL